MQTTNITFAAYNKKGYLIADLSAETERPEVILIGLICYEFGVPMRVYFIAEPSTYTNNGVVEQCHHVRRAEIADPATKQFYACAAVPMDKDDDIAPEVRKFHATMFAIYRHYVRDFVKKYFDYVYFTPNSIWTVVKQ